MARLQDWRANEPFRSRLHAQPKVIAYQQTGRVEEARRTAEQLIAARLNFTIDAWLKTHFRRDMARVEADTASVGLSAVLEDPVETSFSALRNVEMT